MRDDEIKKIVRNGYAKIVQSGTLCCGLVNSCCGSSELEVIKDISKNIGYTEQEINSVPEGANLGLGCGNPVALASIKEGETVLDLGSGAGFDSFLAAQRVGQMGRVIGVDMTPEMIAAARKNAEDGNFENLEFRLGELENLPVADTTIDLIISNCVINLVPSKERVFKEAFRVLKPGGRLMISDIVLLKKLPEFVINSMEAYIGCVSGAILKEDYIKSMKNAGFEDIKILDQTSFPIDVLTINPRVMETIKQMDISVDKLKDLANSVVSVKVEAIKKVAKVIKSKENNNLLVDIYVPLNACACEWSQFMDRIFAVLTPYIKYIKYETKSLNSEEARNLNLRGNCVIIDGEKKFKTSVALKRELPKLLKEKGII
jgi:arsenite methyltransferase